MRLLRCLLTENDCYKAGRTIVPQGVMVHSTGANNPNLKRYVQPLAGAADYGSLTALLGTNQNRNDWNRAGVGACVHAFIGRLMDGAHRHLPDPALGHAGLALRGGRQQHPHLL